MTRVSKEIWSLVGGLFCDDSDTDSFLIPVIRLGESNQSFTQICYSEISSRFDVLRLSTDKIDVKLPCPIAVDPLKQRLAILFRNGVVRYAGDAKNIENTINQQELSKFPKYLALQFYDITDDDVAAAQVENDIIRELTNEPLFRRQAMSFNRSCSRSAFYSLACRSLKKSDSERQELKNISKISRSVEDWSLDNLLETQRDFLSDRLTVTLEKFSHMLENRKPSGLHISDEILEHEMEDVEEILRDIRRLRRQELRIGRLISEIVERPYLGSKIFENYQPYSKWEKLVFKYLRSKFDEKPFSTISKRRLFDDVLSYAFYHEYSSHKGILLKDLARQLNSYPAAVKSIRNILRKNSYLWSVDQWYSVIDAHLDGRVMSENDEHSEKHHYLQGYPATKLGLQDKQLSLFE